MSVHVTVVAVVTQYVLHLVSVCILPLVTRHPNHIFPAPHYIVICGLSVSTIFIHTTNKRQIFGKRY